MKRTPDFSKTEGGKTKCPIRLRRTGKIIEGYLGSLPANVREGELREISGHLQQLVEDLRTQGHGEEAATSLAIARFGSARRVGVKLRDVWEGNRGLFVTLLAVGGSNWLLNMINTAAYLIIPFATLSLNGALGEAVAPVFIIWGWAILLVFPFAWNFFLGRWGGRRTAIEAALIYLLMGFAPLPIFQRLFVSACLSSPPRFWFSEGTANPGFAYASSSMAVMAALGAWYGSTAQRRERWAAIGGTSFDQAAVLLAKPRRGRRIPLARRLLALSIIGVLAFWMTRRVEFVLHPPTPEAAVHAALNDAEANANMAPATDVSLRTLPPETTAEQAEQERRVAYSVTMHVTQEYRRRHVAFMQRDLQAEREGRYHEYPAYYARAILARLRPDGYRIQGILRVRKTPDGWQVSESSEQDIKQKKHLYVWLYDIPLKNPNPDSRTTAKRTYHRLGHN